MSVRQVTLFECDHCHKRAETPGEVRGWEVKPSGPTGVTSTFDACSAGCAVKLFKEIADVAYERTLPVEA